ncbi:hypothetical protein IWW48_003651 [Coemansia sp. RSA 1200]|nr:hypothetical protein IWW48_003651 [Coemansia sp. RSA 1200]
MSSLYDTSLLAKDNGNTSCLGNSNESPEIQGASPHIYEDDNGIMFDSSGDLHFILPRVSEVQSHTTDEDMQTVLYPVSSPGILTHNIRTSIPDSEQPLSGAGKEDVSKAQLAATNLGTSSGDGKSKKVETLGMVSSNMANIIPGGSSPISPPTVSQGGSEALLEIIEDAVMQTLPPVVQTNRLASSRFASSSARPKPDRMRHDSQGNSHVFDSSNTYSLDITGLWGNTCVWDDERLLYTKAGVLTKVCAQKLVANRAVVASKMYTNSSADVAACLFTVLCKDTFPSEQSYLSGDNKVPSPDIDKYKNITYENIDKNSLYGSIGSLDDEEDIEVELGRGASDPIEPERLIQDADILDLHTDIPWLNPNIMQTMDPRKPASLPMSVRTESSPDIGMRHSIGEACDHSPSISAAPFPDLPISDEQIEIQQFLLAADCLVNKDSTSGGSIASDMDSFLGPERVNNSLHQELSTEVIDVELQSFQRFMVVRMKECGKSAITFSNVLTDPFKTRRAAARAFVDILQMATMSVFRVSQDIASREINISLT